MIEVDEREYEELKSIRDNFKNEMDKLKKEHEENVAKSKEEYDNLKKQFDDVNSKYTSQTAEFLDYLKGHTQTPPPNPEQPKDEFDEFCKLKFGGK